MNILYAVLCSEGNIDRTLNVTKLKETIPEMKVVFSNRENVFNNHIGLFKLCASSDADGIVIFEDDIQLCKDFKNKLFNILQSHKNEVVSMFESAMTKSELHSEYRLGSKFAWNQCNYYPKHICQLLCDEKEIPLFKDYFFTKFNEPWNYPIDRYIAYILGKYNIKYWMQVPFLVQHLALKSNFKGRPLNRQSKYFIDDLEENNV